MAKTYKTGDEFQGSDMEFREYGIHETRPELPSYAEPNTKKTRTHYQKIVVYGDEALRDKILKLLQENPDG